MNPKEQNFFQLYEPTKKVKNDHVWKILEPKKEKIPHKEVSRDTDACKSSDLQFSKHCSIFFLYLNSLLSAKSNLSEGTMPCNTSLNLDKQTSTDYVDFSKCQDRLDFFIGPN